MDKNSRILVTGAQGLVGSALLTELSRQGFSHLIPVRRAECDLTDRASVEAFFSTHRPTHVFHAAGQVYGIMGNMQNKALAFLNNTLINTHVVEASRRSGVEKIVALGTIAAYPEKFGENPIREEIIFNGRPHHAEDSYAQAKRAMLAQLEAYRQAGGLDFVFAISTNLYGENDRFDEEWAHVVPALVRKFAIARREGGSVSVWGDGSATRDFLYSGDAARALIALMEKGTGPINMARGEITPIRQVVELLQRISGVSTIEWDTSKPTGQTLRQFDIEKLRQTGFVPQVSLEDGLRRTYEWYVANALSARAFR